MLRGSLLQTQRGPRVLPSEVDPGVSPHQSVSATQTLSQNVFITDFRWFAAAAALDIIVVLAVLPLFWGFWSLSKHKSLSPLQLAIAFDSPLTAGVHSAASTAGAVEVVGETRVAYGLTSATGTNGVTTSSDAARLGIAEQDRVWRPRKGDAIDL